MLSLGTTRLRRLTSKSLTTAAAHATPSRKDKPVEETRGDRIEDEAHLIGHKGIWNVEPIRTQADAIGIGLGLQMPADVIGGPGKAEEAL